jgi:transaldolase
MRPKGLQTKIFLDSGDPQETKKAIALLGFLDGQTTNPSLVVKSPEAQAFLAQKKGLTGDERNQLYKKLVTEISQLIPQGSVSIEVEATLETSAENLLQQAREMNAWIPNAHIKFPITKAALQAAKQAVKEGIRVNMTLCFSQEQAAAVYAATLGAKKGDVFISPFIGRLDDQGQKGMDLIQNIVHMYRTGDGHGEVLSASVRNLEHFLAAIQVKSDSITAPLSILEAWATSGMEIPDENFSYTPALSSIPYKQIDLNKDLKEYDITHPLTTSGIQKFTEDWEKLGIPNLHFL